MCEKHTPDGRLRDHSLEPSEKKVEGEVRNTPKVYGERDTEVRDRMATERHTGTQLGKRRDLEIKG